MPIPKAGEQNYCVMTQGISREGDRIEMTVARLRHGPVPEGEAGMKRASAGTAPLRNGSGSATKRAVHTGLRPEDAAFLSKLRLGAPAAAGAPFARYHGSGVGPP